MKIYWQDAQCTIYHGSAEELIDRGELIDCLLTDPPYGIGARMIGGANAGYDVGMMADQREWDQHTFSRMSELLALAGEAIVWGGNYYAMPPSRGWLVWDKSPKLATMADVELAWTSMDRNSKSYSCSRNMRNRQHPTQKPLTLMQWCIGFFSSGGIIVDPFMGSGTTLVAAKNLGRMAVGVESREEYCEIAKRRLAQGVLIS